MFNEVVKTSSSWDFKYAAKRKHCFYTSFRLQKRYAKIVSVIEKHVKINDFSMLDIGSADGRMLSMLAADYPKASFTGLEPSKAFEQNVKAANMVSVSGSIENFNPAQKFDVILLAAVIEHLEKPQEALIKVRSLLNKGGIAIITYPNPVFDRINSLLVDNGHINRFSKNGMIELIGKCGLKVREFNGFMVNPFVTVPIFDDIVEYAAKTLSIDMLLFNRMVVAEAYA